MRWQPAGLATLRPKFRKLYFANLPIKASDDFSCMELCIYIEREERDICIYIGILYI